MNKKALGLAGLGAVALVGGSLAYFSQTSTLENPFTTGHYNTDLHEDYTPPIDDLTPGAEWDKKVGATNTGDYPVLVRIKMDERWIKKNAAPNEGAYIEHSSSEGKDFIGEDNAYNGKTFIANQRDIDKNDRYLGDVDGLVKSTDGTIMDATTVYKNMNHIATSGGEDGWYYNADDGYWYWTKVLPGGESTSNLMDSLVLASNLDLGRYIKTEKYQIQTVAEGGNLNDLKVVDTDWKKLEKVTPTDGSEAYYKVFNTDAEDDFIKVVDRVIKEEDENKENAVGGNGDGQLDIIDIAIAKDVEAEKQKIFWESESELDENASGYADSNYTLSITAEFIQADLNAVEEEWEKDEDGRDITNLVGTDGKLTKITAKSDSTILE